MGPVRVLHSSQCVCLQPYIASLLAHKPQLQVRDSTHLLSLRKRVKDPLSQWACDSLSRLNNFKFHSVNHMPIGRQIVHMPVAIATGVARA